MDKALAVIGIGCRLPGGVSDAEQYWQALLEGRNGIRPVPEDRWDNAFFFDPDKDKAGKTKNDRGGFIEGVDQFDAEFFGYFPAEASRIDPQQRLLLEVAHEALEDAGLPVEKIAGTRTSVFVGSFMYDYLCLQTASEARELINPYVAMGTGLTSLANRISYVFDLKGPSVSLDTACSSSLVALHLAARSVWNGEADMAIAGGVNLILRPESTVMLSKAGFLNPDGSCKAFDATANGYVRAEGAGVVILKDLRRAIDDGDKIYAVVRGSAVNQDGYVPEGFTVPSKTSQIAVLEAAYADAGIDPTTVQYVEAHGTGTAVGDPIECTALGTVLGQQRTQEAPCLVGSVKTHLGHLEGAAGIAGFIKGVLVARHRHVPANLHFHTPNPAIDFAGLKLQVADRGRPLDESRPVRVGVNSFGAGGTNAHVVLESFSSPADAEHPAALAAPRPFVVSAKSKDALAKLAAAYRDRLASDVDGARLDLAALGSALLARRSRYPFSATLVASSATELGECLGKLVDGAPDERVATVQARGRQAPRLAFMFSGQGGQWPRMGLSLYDREPVFRETIDTIDRLFAQLSGTSLLAHIQASPEDTKINQTVVVQPAIMAIQIGLARLLMHYGVKAAGFVGHSIGEVAAAHLAGAITLEQAVQVIFHRSQIQDRASGKGKMLAAAITEAEALELLRGHEARASIAAYNGPRMLALSGDVPVLEEIASVLDAQGTFHRFVRVDVPYHSHHMEPLEDAMLSALGGVRGVPATTPLYSTVSGAREPGTHLEGRYWYDNVRRPVLMTQALTRMLDDGFNLFVEVGPHPVLLQGALDLLKELGRQDASACASMQRSGSQIATFHRALGHLVAHGITPDVERLFGPRRRNGAYLPLPKHPWNRQRYWFELPAASRRRLRPYTNPLLKEETRLVSESSARVWDTYISAGSFPFLKDHQVDGEVVVPATAHLETACAVGREAYPGSEISIRDVHFDAALILPDEHKLPLDVRLEVTSSEGHYHICSRPLEAADDVPWTRHSSGRIDFLPDGYARKDVDFPALARRCEGHDVVDVKGFYDGIRKAGLDYGPAFQCITRLWHRGDEIFAHLRLPDALHHEAARMGSHPALLDACLHAVFVDVHRRGDPSRVYLPYAIDRLKSWAPLPPEVRCHIRVAQNDETFLAYDVTVFSPAGEVLAAVDGITCKIIGGAHARLEEKLYDGCYEYAWEEDETRGAQLEKNHDLRAAVVVATDPAAAAPLVDALAGRGLAVTVLDGTAFRGGDGRRRLVDELRPKTLDRRTLLVAFCDPRTGQDLEPWLGDGGVPLEVEGLLHLTQTMAELQVSPRFALVTCGSVLAAPADSALHVGQSALVGMMRVFKNEHPNIPARVVDLPASPVRADYDALAHELCALRLDLDEVEVALRAGRRWLRALRAVQKDSAEAKAALMLPGVGGGYRAGLAETGSLDSVELRQIVLPSPGDGEVEIEVHAAALNFKDIVNGMGVLPEKAVRGGLAGHQLGLEVSGRVVRAGGDGRGCNGLTVGQRVMARVTHGFSGRVIARADCVAPLPEHLSWEEGAAIPVVTLTAYYGLVHLGRMQEGDTVLIHSAAGGVGTAAIELARLVGARVIATAGTREKRESLRAMGIEHVFDSRSLDFHARVMEVTGGVGVDIVLNALTGSFITQGIKSLAPFGRFIEIGKADIYKNAKLSMERLGENISFHVVDVDRMATQRPRLHRQMLQAVAELFSSKKLTAPKVTAFPITRLADAFKAMSRAAYVGKIVVRMEGETVRALPARRLVASAEGSYLISGGASGFGLEIGRWLVARGARHLVLASRSGPKSEADRRMIDDLRRQGVDVVEERLDVADARAVEAVLARFGSSWPALRGVFHAAGVLADASLGNLDAAQFRAVFVPKAVGAWNLHRALEKLKIEPELFVNLSSISSVLGLFGQANYASANYVLDSLAELRARQGQAGTSLNLGVLGDYAGMSRKDKDGDDVLAMLESHGMPPMALADVLGKLELSLCQRAGQRMTARFDWSRFTAVYPHLQRDLRFAACIAASRNRHGAAGKGAGGLVAQLAATADEGKQRALLSEELAKTLGRILDLAPQKIDTSASIDAFSLDSLVLNQLRNWMLRNLDVNLPLIKLLKGPSIDELSEMLLAQLDRGGAEAGASGAAAQHGARPHPLLDDARIEAPSPWLIRGAGDRTRGARLFCFHSMGTGASLFTRFLVEPPAGYDVFAVQTPGRENRSAEPALDRVEALADHIVGALEPWLDRPFAIWGHSFGGIVAYETIRRLRRQHGKDPFGFVVTGTVAPRLISIWQKREVMLKTLVADNSAEYLISLSRYVDDAELIKAILPLMRKDTPLMMSYHHSVEAPFAFPIVAFGARQDDMVYLDEIRPWSEETKAGFELCEVDGDHWFLNKNRELISKKLEELLHRAR